MENRINFLQLRFSTYGFSQTSWISSKLKKMVVSLIEVIIYKFMWAPCDKCVLCKILKRQR